jgi:hypothetical protein
LWIADWGLGIADYCGLATGNRSATRNPHSTVIPHSAFRNPK